MGVSGGLSNPLIIFVRPHAQHGSRRSCRMSKALPLGQKLNPWLEHMGYFKLSHQIFCAFIVFLCVVYAVLVTSVLI
jgi:hypothetical protein